MADRKVSELTTTATMDSADLFYAVVSGESRAISLDDLGQSSNMGSALQTTASGATTARAIGAFFADVVNVKDYGAVGDSITDDAPAFRAAIASNRKIIVPPGTYLMGSVLSLVQPPGALNNPTLRMDGLQNVELVGYGATIIFGATVTAAPYLWLEITTSDDQKALGNYSRNIIIRGFKITHSRGSVASTLTQANINISHSENVLMDDLDISHDGVNNSAFSGTSNRSVHYKRCFIDNCNKAFDLTQFENLTIECCSMRSGSADGSGGGVNLFWDKQTSHFANLEVPLRHGQSTNVIIRNNDIDEFVTGVFLSAVRGAVVCDNSIHDGQNESTGDATGILIDSGNDGFDRGFESSDIAIYENEIFGFVSGGGGGGYGIRFATGGGTRNVKHISITRNKIFNNDTQAIIADNTASLTNIRVWNNDYISRDENNSGLLEDFAMTGISGSFEVGENLEGSNISITSIAEGGGPNATVTTSSNHNLAVGDTATISGSSVAKYNGPHRVASTPTPTTYTFNVADAGLGDDNPSSATLDKAVAEIRKISGSTLTVRHQSGTSFVTGQSYSGSDSGASGTLNSRSNTQAISYGTAFAGAVEAESLIVGRSLPAGRNARILVSSEAADANVDLILVPKGSGVLRFGAHTAIGAEALSGFITIKDNNGTTRKLAVVS